MKSHAVVIPYPAQGHIAPVLKLAKLLHYKGFFITFVNTEFNHNRLVRARGADAVKGLEDFQFKTIPDGLPPSDDDATQDIPLLSQSISRNCLAPFLDLIKNLNESSDCPNVSCIVSDLVMSFTLDAADQLNIPEALFYTASACGFMGYTHYAELVARGYVPLKDESCLTNGYLETEIDWIPGMKGIRLKDIPTFIRTTDPNAIMLKYNIVQHGNASRAKAIIFNTFDELEEEVLEAIRDRYDQVYTIGPLQLLEKEIYITKKLKSIGSNLWKEDMDCLNWLDQREENSVLYINFGSITPLSPEQAVEFAWGLAKSNHHFLWIIRPDLMNGKGSILPEGFLEETQGRGLMVGWCPQEQVLAHPAIGGFLTHCGWNSTIETISEGVPMVCWPFFAEQQTNCRYACAKWDIGVEIEGDVNRGKVEKMVRVMMEGEEGKEMRKKALEWKEKAHLAAKPGGSSYHDFEKLIHDTLLDN
nr:uridine 5'-diphospho-glycosyltransferase 1 [Ligustrum robustum]